MITEADTCRKYVLPKLVEAGWDTEPHSFTEQKTLLDNQHRIVAYLDDLQPKVDALKRLQEETAKELDAMLPSVLNRAFRGEL
jgi:hypothetical protein